LVILLQKYEKSFFLQNNSPFFISFFQFLQFLIPSFSHSLILSFSHFLNLSFSHFLNFI